MSRSTGSLATDESSTIFILLRPLGRLFELLGLSGLLGLLGLVTTAEGTAIDVSKGNRFCGDEGILWPPGVGSLNWVIPLLPGLGSENRVVLTSAGIFIFSDPEKQGEL